MHKSLGHLQPLVNDQGRHYNGFGRLPKPSINDLLRKISRNQAKKIKSRGE